MRSIDPQLPLTQVESMDAVVAEGQASRRFTTSQCAAARTDADVGDIKTLASLLGLASSAKILEVVTRYFPEERLFDDGA